MKRFQIVSEEGRQDVERTTRAPSRLVVVALLYGSTGVVSKPSCEIVTSQRTGGSLLTTSLNFRRAAALGRPSSSRHHAQLQERKPFVFPMGNRALSAKSPRENGHRDPTDHQQTNPDAPAAPEGWITQKGHYHQGNAHGNRCQTQESFPRRENGSYSPHWRVPAKVQQ